MSAFFTWLGNYLIGWIVLAYLVASLGVTWFACKLFAWSNRKPTPKPEWGSRLKGVCLMDACDGDHLRWSAYSWCSRSDRMSVQCGERVA